MGVVYRAEDSKLDREVAIKVLPTDFTKDPERLARFEREAKVLASLNQQNIAAIHQVEEVEGTHFQGRGKSNDVEQPISQSGDLVECGPWNSLEAMGNGGASTDCDELAKHGNRISSNLSVCWSGVEG